MYDNSRCEFEVFLHVPLRMTIFKTKKIILLKETEETQSNKEGSMLLLTFIYLYSRLLQSEVRFYIMQI